MEPLSSQSLEAVKLQLQEVLPLRALVLREGKLLPEACINEGDEAANTFHAGCKDATGLVLAIATCMQEDYPGYKGIGYRLRGMAVHPDKQRQGLGDQALRKALFILKERNTDYIWCNARKVAYDFYLQAGFDFISDEFDILGIGPHKVMILLLK
jgi:predicted GNAT family N-acyltransferase